MGAAREIAQRGEHAVPVDESLFSERVERRATTTVVPSAATAMASVSVMPPGRSPTVWNVTPRAGATAKSIARALSATGCQRDIFIS